MISEIPTMLTIKETASKLGLSDYYLRGLVRSNKIVYVKVGAKYLINLEKLVDFLNNGGERSAAEAEAESAQPLIDSRIRRIEG